MFELERMLRNLEQENMMQAVEHYIEKFVPEHYDLFLDWSRETKTFSRKLTITGQAKSDLISLNQKDL